MATLATTHYAHRKDRQQTGAGAVELWVIVDTAQAKSHSLLITLLFLLSCYHRCKRAKNKSSKRHSFVSFKCSLSILELALHDADRQIITSINCCYLERHGHTSVLGLQLTTISIVD